MKSHETAINHHFFVQNTGEIQPVSPLFHGFSRCHGGNLGWETPYPLLNEKNSYGQWEYQDPKLEVPPF